MQDSIFMHNHMTAPTDICQVSEKEKEMQAGVFVLSRVFMMIGH